LCLLLVCILLCYLAHLRTHLRKTTFLSFSLAFRAIRVLHANALLGGLISPPPPLLIPGALPVDPSLCNFLVNGCCQEPFVHFPLQSLLSGFFLMRATSFICFLFPHYKFRVYFLVFCRTPCCSPRQVRPGCYRGSAILFTFAPCLQFAPPPSRNPNLPSTPIKPAARKESPFVDPPP